MKKTILHDLHITLGAKMAPFGGYEMPIQYSAESGEPGGAGAQGFR